MATSRVIGSNQEWKKRKACADEVQIVPNKIHQSTLESRYLKTALEEMGKLHLEKALHSKEILDNDVKEKEMKTIMAEKDKLIAKLEEEMTSLQAEITRKNQNIELLEKDACIADINNIIIREDNDSLSRENVQLGHQKVEFDNLSKENLSLKKIIDEQKELISEMNDDVEAARLDYFDVREMLEHQIEDLQIRVNEFIESNKSLTVRLERQQHWDLYSNLPCDDDEL